MPTREHAVIGIKRAYEPPARGDGHRVLVDRLWPRGIGKEALARAATGRVTLVYAARDSEHNNAVVLRGVVAPRARRLRGRV